MIVSKNCDCPCIHTRLALDRPQLCCRFECIHNSTPERLAEISAEMKAKEKERDEKYWKDNNMEPFDMKEWYKRIYG